MRGLGGGRGTGVMIIFKSLRGVKNEKKDGQTDRLTDMGRQTDIGR